MTRPLCPADLVPGRMYFSPSGRLCVMQQPGESGLGCNSFMFAYVSARTGREKADDGFWLSAENARAIATMREAPIVQPEFAARFGVAA